MTGRHLPPALFPQEIWCCIWGELPFASRVAVTHTCRLWRSVSLSCPGLWTHVTFFTAIHDERRLVGPPHRGWRDIYYRDGTTNIGSAQDILARSRGLPLHLTLDIVPGSASLPELQNLASRMMCATHRLVYLRIRSCDLSAAKVFLGHFEILPALQSLSLEQPKSLDHHMQLIFSGMDGLLLPKIRTLHFDVGYAFPLTDPGPPLTTVRTFSLRPYCVPDAVIHHAVAVLPNLLSLHIDFADLMQNAKPTADAAPVRQLAANIPSVIVAAVPDRCAAWVLAAFHEPARPTLALERCLSPFNVDLCAILGDLGQDICLRVVTTHDRRVAITGVDAQGLERRIESARDVDLSSLFADTYLNRDNVVEMSVCTSLLPRIVHTFDNVTNLILLVDDLGFLAAHPLPALPAFPALQTLTLLDGLDAVQRFAGDVSDLVHALAMPVPLKEISIDHRMFLTDVDELSNLAGSLNVGVFHIL